MQGIGEAGSNVGVSTVLVFLFELNGFLCITLSSHSTDEFIKAATFTLAHSQWFAFEKVVVCSSMCIVCVCVHCPLSGQLIYMHFWFFYTFFTLKRQPRTNCQPNKIIIMIIISCWTPVNFVVNLCSKFASRNQFDVPFEWYRNYSVVKSVYD